MGQASVAQVPLSQTLGLSEDLMEVERQEVGRKKFRGVRDALCPSWRIPHGVGPIIFDPP